ncbi:hypothetical protein AB0942_06250 [Streptomyces nodosus]|uniref:hypothetical protein n=1 Tax=Streptomyces nodosus TaxID=40318 RepID=UPI0034565215
MAWEEWEQLKASAIERQSMQKEPTHAPLDPGDGSGTLVSNKPAWSRAGRDVGSFHQDIGKALRKLSEGQEGLGTGTGCLTTGAQKGVYGSWERYVKSVTERCEHLAGLLEKAGTDHLKTDEAVVVEISNLKADYTDTAAVGGQDKVR